MATCQICGTEFNGLHSKQKFCGKVCREAHYAEYRLTAQYKNKSVVIQLVERLSVTSRRAGGQRWL